MNGNSLGFISNIGVNIAYYDSNANFVNKASFDLIFVADALN